MKLIIDKTVFKDEKFYQWLLENDKTIYLPAISYLEYLNQQIKKGNTASMLDAVLKEMNIEVVALDSTIANQATQLATENDDLIHLTITGTVLQLQGTLVTSDPQEYPYLDEVKIPAEILK